MPAPMITEVDLRHLRRAVELAEEAERYGNLPIGSVVAAGDQVVAEARNAVIEPELLPGRHAEVEAIKKVPSRQWARPKRLTLYSTLEPCIMCLGTALLHGIPRVVFGATDPEGGGGQCLSHLPRYYHDRTPIEWIGPALATECDPLYQRARSRFIELPFA